MTWKPSRIARRTKQAKPHRRKQAVELRTEHWLTRHEAERDEADEALARRMADAEDRGHG